MDIEAIRKRLEMAQAMPPPESDSGPDLVTWYIQDVGALLERIDGKKA